MTLSDLGNLGNLIGGIAVAATLVYLAVQVRQNSKIAQATVRQSLVQNQISYMSLRSTDPMIRTAFRKASAHEQLSDEEAFALLFHATVGIRLWEGLHSQLEHGMVAKEDWLAVRHIMSVHFQLPIYRQALDRLGPDGVNPRFFAEVRQIVEQVQK
jgi:hypothetical protein